MVKKDYILTDHAKQRMEQRNISEEEIEVVLKSPDTTHIGECGEVRKIKTINGRKIKVVFKTESKQRIIITAMIMGE